MTKIAKSTWQRSHFQVINFTRIKTTQTLHLRPITTIKVHRMQSCFSSLTWKVLS